ncbi:PAS/PAC sensor signal transduction histidine kinase [Roseibium hamelinense]|uniref:Sensor protein FixL n=1 Tax=Roseibium hamelinense TaxID=150831 RepID=A0A562SVH0_9HYPH|nr:PAS domain S-box protein [Roseibium hamelinense]MTI42433.1 PAS domain S-box protein [Roseibium hamelinense]TWI84680.1 PAS/PAC sensor signal transduction histidine kinase [Roseibium hamelinense]
MDHANVTGVENKDDAHAASTVSEARLASVFDTAADGMIVINEKCQVLAFNKASERLFGYTASEVIGDNVHKIMSSEYAAAHDSYVKHYLETGQKRIIGIGREVRGRHKDGTEFPIELSVGEATTPEGRQFIGILRDLRPRRSVEERLAQAQAQLVHMTRMSALDEMGAAIAHELNQPLTALMLYLQALSRKLSQDGDLPQQVTDIIGKSLGEAERASDIIQRMRQLVERKEPERQTIDVKSFTEDCIGLVKLGASTDDVLVQCTVADDLPLLEADPVQIRQVLVNLLRNARDAVAGQTEKQIWITVRANGNGVEFVIEDNGPGVPAHAIPDLFRAFSSKKQKGLGLGLAISRSIAQNHGGDLVLETANPDRGAVFILRLPAGAGPG